jgi:hypothetical protein
VDRDLKAFRQAAEERGLGRRGRRYPEELRELAVKYWRRAERDGTARGAVANELGVAEQTLSRWEARLPTPSTASEIREVVVIEDDEPLFPPTLALVTPSGYRVEGLSLDDVSVLLGALR